VQRVRHVDERDGDPDHDESAEPDRARPGSHGYRAERDAEHQRDDSQSERAALAWGAGKPPPSWQSRVCQSLVDTGIDLPADLVEEGFDDSRLIFRTELAVRLGGCANLVGR